MSKRTVLSGAVALVLICSAANAAPPATGSAYFTDPQFSHVEDQTSEGIGQVNMIACFISAMRPDAMVNKGDYIALVDENKCDQAKRSSSSNSSSSGDGSQAANYTTAIVNSARTTNSDPMRVKTWVSEKEDGQSMTIFVNTSATSAPTTANPFGVFRLDFCGKPDGVSGPCMMNGFLDAQDGALSFFQNEGGGGQSNVTALKLSSVGTSSGSGRMSITRTDGGSSMSATFNFAFDQSHFLRGDQCFSRDAADPETRFSVWRYGLYDSVTGARVNRSSGFPIEYTSGGQTYHGYLGYWGLSLPGNVSIANGATVDKVDYTPGQSPTRTSYTVTKAGGKLTKYTLRTKKLNELDKIKFNAFIGNVTGFFAGATANRQYEMYWDNTAGNFKVTAQMNCGQDGCQTQSLPSVQTVAASFFASMGAQGWSQSLGGEVFIDLRGVTGSVTSSSINVNYRVQDLVYPGQIPTQLYCISNCPTAASLNAYFTSTSGTPTSPFGTTFNVFNPVGAGAVVAYNGDTANALLRDSLAQAVTFTDSQALQQKPQYANGVRSGRLFTSLPSVECSPSSGTYCDHKVNSLDVYYVWETGANQWNQFAAVKDSSGNFVNFDAPLQVNFNVPTGAQYGQLAGKSIVLQYGGFGDLWGIPGSCVSRVTNQPVSCDTQDSRYVPEFIIPMSDTLGVVTSGSTTYLVKWLDREIRFARKSLSACGSLTLPNSVTLPDVSGLKDPSNSASPIYIGAKPTVTGAPRVIHGDVKY